MLKVGGCARKKMNLADINNLCEDESELLGFLQSTNLLLGKKMCNKCRKACKISKRNDNFHYYCSKCNKKYAASGKNSFLSRSKLKYELVLKVIFLFLKGERIKDARKIIGISQKTLVDWYNFCREVCEIELFNSKEKIGGEGKIVEIDEFVCRKDILVIGGIERGSESCFFVPVASTDSKTLTAIIQEYVNPGSTVVTDECLYKNLDTVDVYHLKVNHAIDFADPESGRHNTTEGTWSKIKSRLDKQVSQKDFFHSYLSTYLWKKKNKGGNMFLKYLEVIGKQNFRTHKLEPWGGGKKSPLPDELNDRESASTSGESSFGATDVAAESRVPSNIVEDGSMSEEITGSSNSIYIQESSHDTGIINSDTVESAFDRYVSTEPLGNKMNDSLSRCKPTICKDYVADSVSTKNEVEDDEFDAFGRYVAASLRKMPAENALSVENRIYTVINSERKLILLQDRNKSDDNVLEIKVEVQEEPL